MVEGVGGFFLSLEMLVQGGFQLALMSFGGRWVGKSTKNYIHNSNFTFSWRQDQVYKQNIAESLMIDPPGAFWSLILDGITGRSVYTKQQPFGNLLLLSALHLSPIRASPLQPPTTTPFSKARCISHHFGWKGWRWPCTHFPWTWLANPSTGHPLFSWRQMA